MKPITYAIAHDRPLTRYLLNFLCVAAGIPTVEAAPGQPVDLYYGPTPRACRLFIPDQPHDAPRLRATTTSDDLIEGSSFTFDLLHEIGLFLTDAVHANLPATAYDAHDRLLAAHSYQLQHGLAHIPVVNRAVKLFADIVRERCGIQPLPRWPQGKHCAIALSHDVDQPIKYAVRAHLGQAIRRRGKAALRQAARALKAFAVSYTDPLANGYWLFPEIIALESSLGFRSAFYFAARNRYHAHGTEADVEYDIAWREFRRLFPVLLEHGDEIGLHAAYNTYQRDEWFAEEKDRLERLAGCEVLGLRHHFWHLGPDPLATLARHARTGFRYDASLAFNETIGWRMNTALPFFPWGGERTIPCLQLPTFCMDGHFFYHHSDATAAVTQFTDYLGTLQHYGGAGLVDWHVRTSYPRTPEYRHWGEAYVQILHMLAADSSIWVTTPADLYRWWTDRTIALQN